MAMYIQLVKMLKALSIENSMHRRINPIAIVFSEDSEDNENLMRLKDFDAVRKDA